MSTILKDSESISKILSEMTIEEKALMVTGGAPFATQAMPKYGIPSAVMMDGGTGYNFTQHGTQAGFEEGIRQLSEEGKTLDREALDAMGGTYFGQSVYEETPALSKDTISHERGCYPSGMLLAATFNPDVINHCGYVLGKEMSFLGVDCVLGSPNVNIHRDPLNGRLFEGYSEDPCLVSKCAPAFVKGVQAAGPAANVKHFAANNQETNRQSIDEHIPLRALMEIYFPGFASCVKAGCKTVMSAYNKINGTYCSVNEWLLTTILRNEWGFEGFVMSDWSGAINQVGAILAGNDLAMPGPRGIKVITDAVNSGKLREEQLDKSISAFLHILLQMPVMKGRVTEFNVKEAQEATEKAATEGITLLKNDGVLPLKDDTKVKICGKRSYKFQGCGAGSAYVETTLMTNPYDSICALCKNVQNTEEPADVWIVTVGANGQEGSDRRNMMMDEDDRLELEKAVSEARRNKVKVVLLINAPGPVELIEYITDVNAIVFTYYSGMQGGKVIADILFGRVNPSGKLPFTYPKYYRDVPTYRNFPGDEQDVWYGEGIYLGYRYYDVKAIEPLFPFGHGLSYTSFEIGNLQVPETIDLETSSLPISVMVTNTGIMAGSETIQLYIHKTASRMDQPVKELKEFRKVFLHPGESIQIQFLLEKNSFASFSTQLYRFVTEPGEVELWVGTSAGEIYAKKDVMIHCINPFPFTVKTAIGEIMDNREVVDALEEILGLHLNEVAGETIVYSPSKSWEDVWNIHLLPYLQKRSKSKEEIDSLWDLALINLAKYWNIC